MVLLVGRGWLKWKKLGGFVYCFVSIASSIHSFYTFVFSDVLTKLRQNDPLTYPQDRAGCSYDHGSLYPILCYLIHRGQQVDPYLPLLYLG